MDLIEKYDRIAAVNLYLRNSWYHQAMKQFIDEGEIGELAILRICHMTPGLAPGEGHEYEGPAYHDCGMHYIDIARWYADSEYKTWHAQGMRMWDYKDPWWSTVPRYVREQHRLRCHTRLRLRTTLQKPDS